MPEKDKSERKTIDITLQADVGGATLAIELSLDPATSSQAFDDRLDFASARLGRQRARHELSEKLLAREIAQDMLDNWESDRDTALKAKATERAQTISSWQATHAAFNKRGEFRMNAQQQQAIANLDQNIETTRMQYDERKQKLQQDVRLVDKQIARLRALIAGHDPVDEDIEEEPLREAAE